MQVNRASFGLNCCSIRAAGNFDRISGKWCHHPVTWNHSARSRKLQIKVDPMSVSVNGLALNRRSRATNGGSELSAQIRKVAEFCRTVCSKRHHSVRRTDSNPALIVGRCFQRPVSRTPIDLQAARTIQKPNGKWWLRVSE